MQLAFGVAGAIVGAYFGAPTVGFAIGSAIGGAVEASNQKIVSEGPRLSDLRVTISSYGVFIPRVFVRGKISGNIIDGADEMTPSEHTQTSGGKGGPTSVQKTTTYSYSFLVLLCKSNGDRDVARIWANGKLLWSRTPDTDAAALLANTTMIDQIIVYKGGDNQLPDPTLEALHGVGNVPAYLGELSVMFVDFQLADFSNNVAATQLTFEVVQDVQPTLSVKLLHQKNYGAVALADPAALWVVASDGVYQDYLDGTGLHWMGTFQTSDKVRALATKVGDDNHPACQIDFVSDAQFDGAVIGPPALVYRLIYGASAYVNPLFGGGYECRLAFEAVQSVHFYTPLGQKVGSIDSLSSLAAWRLQHPDTNYGANTKNLASFGGATFSYVVDPSSGESELVPSSNDGVFAYAETVNEQNNARHSWLAVRTKDGQRVYADDVFGAARICGLRYDNGRLYVLLAEQYTSTGYLNNCRVFDVRNGGDQIAYWQGPRIPSTTGAYDLFVVDDHLNVVSGGALLWKWAMDGTLTDSGARSAAPPPADFVPYAGSIDYRTLLWRPDMTVVSYAAAFASPARMATYVFTDAIDPTGPGLPLRRLITELAAENGVTNLDFAGLPDDVVSEGYIVTRQTSPRVAIDYLRDLHRVDVAESGAKIKFVRRGGPIVRELTMDDLGAMEGTAEGDPPEALEWSTADELGLPAQIVLKFADRANQYEEAAVVVKRVITDSTEVLTLDATACALTGDEAAQLAKLAMDDARLGRDTFAFSTLYGHEDLETADPILLPGAVKKRRGRLTKKIDKGGMLQWEAKHDDPLVLTQYVVGGAATNTPGSSAGASIHSAPVTRVDWLNLPSLRPNDDDQGGYVFAAATARDGYTGAKVYDQAATAPRELATLPGPGGSAGFTTTALQPYAGPAIFDTVSFVDVQLAADVSFESTTRQKVLNGTAGIYLVGDEIIGALRATSLTGGITRLNGGILRGLRGTEAAIGAHVAGEKVYLLDASGLVRDRAGAPSVDGRGVVTVGAVSIGRSTADLDRFSVSAATTAQALLPFAPVHVLIAYGGQQTVFVLKWTRRSRKIQADPFNVPSDDGTYPTFVVVAGASSTADLSGTVQVPGANIGSAQGDRCEWRYTLDSRYYGYLTNQPAHFWMRVHEIGPNARLGAGTPPVEINLAGQPVVFPYGLIYASTTGADGDTAFTDPRYLPAVVSAGPVFGSVHKVGNRAVFAGGADRIEVYGGAMPTSVGIGTLALRTSFKTSAAGVQTLLYHGTHGALKAPGWEVSMNAGHLVVRYGEYTGGSGAVGEFFRTAATYNDNVEHVLEFVVLPAGRFSAVGLRVDGVEVAGAVFDYVTRAGGPQSHDPGYAPMDAADHLYVMGNNRDGTSGFVGTMGDLRGTVPIP